MSDYTLGCFGKLPIHADFIRYNADGVEVSTLDQWIQEGIHWIKSKWGRDWEGAFSHADPWRFVFPVDGTNRFLVGVSLPSRDRGNRLYPFIIFLKVERAHFEAPFYLSPLFFSTFWNAAMEMAQNGWEGLDLKRFLDAFSRFAVSIESDLKSLKESYREALRIQTTQGFWTKILGDFQHSRKYLIDRNMGDLLLPMRHTALSQFGLGLKFPLFLKHSEEGYDIPFWFDLTLRWSQQKNLDPIFFWNRQPGKGMPYLMAFFRFPSPRQFSFLVRPDRNDDSWYDLAPEIREDSEKVIYEIQEDRKKLLDQEDLSLAAFLEAITLPPLNLRGEVGG